MRKLLLTLCFLTCSVLCFNTQLATAQDAINTYEKGELTISPGIAFGSFGYYGGFSGFALPLSVSVEYGFHEYISAGGFAGYTRYNYDYFGGDYSYNFISFGGRGSFHYLPFLAEILDNDDLLVDKLDPYISLLVGYEISNFSSSDPFLDEFNTLGSRFVAGTAAGCRFYPSRNFGVFGEVGRGVNGWLTLGATFKF